MLVFALEICHTMMISFVDSLDLRYTNLRSLVTCLDHSDIA